MKIKVLKIFSKIWLTTEPAKQKFQHRDDVIRISLDIINNHPEVEGLKKILLNEECYLINLHYEKDNPSPPKKSSGKKIVRSYLMVNSWYLTDLTHTLNITPTYSRYGFPACEYEVVEEKDYCEKLNIIIANEVFSTSNSLTEYEKMIGKIFKQYL